MSGKDCVISWDEFSKAVSERFGSKKDLMEEYFNKLLQEIGIHEYVERFEKLKSLMSASNPFFLNLITFPALLMEDITPMLKILKLLSLMVAFEQTKWQQEESNNAMDRNNKMMQSNIPLPYTGRIISNIHNKPLI